MEGVPGTSRPGGNRFEPTLASFLARGAPDPGQRTSTLTWSVLDPRLPSGQSESLCPMPPLFSELLAALATILVVACRTGPPGPTTDRPQNSATPPRLSASAAPLRSALPPLAAESWLITLPVPPKRPALVSVPLGATDPRPIVLGVQGAGDRPEWACGGYRGALDAYPFIVCPAGHPSGQGKLSTGPSGELADDAEQALAGLRARFGAHVAEGPVIYAGFSLGAINAPSLLHTRGRTYPRALLIEGAYREFTPELARRYAASGGERVLMLCAAQSCRGVFDASASALRQAGIETRQVGAGTRRHNLDGEMTEAIRKAWPWLVAGLPSWKPYLEASRRTPTDRE